LVAGLKHQQLARKVGDLAEDLMVNSTASIFIKPIVTLNRGDTFVFWSWGLHRSRRRIFPTPPNHDTQPEDWARDTSRGDHG
jgi:hypothetical protein